MFAKFLLKQIIVTLYGLQTGTCSTKSGEQLRLNSNGRVLNVRKDLLDFSFYMRSRIFLEGVSVRPSGPHTVEIL